MKKEPTQPSKSLDKLKLLNSRCAEISPVYLYFPSLLSVGVEAFLTAGKVVIFLQHRR